MSDGRPHVLLKLAVSADGKAGLAGRRPAPITGEAARARVHRLRATSDAVLTGIGTVLADDPLLTCRLPGMEDRSPVRVVLDTQLRLPLDSRLVASARTTPLWMIAGESAPPERRRALQDRGAEVFQLGARAGRVDLAEAAKFLGRRGITWLLVEAGPVLAASFLTAKLVDEAVLLRSPKALGADAIDGLEGLPLEALTRSEQLQSVGTEALGTDSLELFRRP
jgi:diaminohydroxyphosphoribosylaminopyrimidine deaminase/5-amino-6-(5-phosphoribosylamino)uracil reductase